MKKFIESVCVSEYEIGYMEINNSDYQFKMYRDCKRDEGTPHSKGE